ncbi:MAG: phospho-N-acetylmuramoyl-pentapeptide-transferase, partial [Clostridiales bacterium]|nr:phospho-N-acetylmuramoyl-pentapeptide-transferase [Clostridiales bacterium]
MYLYLIASIVASLALTGILLRIFIPVLKSVHLGQPISEIGPRWHKSKEGTPTLGGIAFIFAFVLCACVISLIIPSKLDLPRLIITLATTVLFGIIGAIDDAAKLRKRENEGLTAPQKFLLQLVVSAAYVGVMAYKGYVSTVMSIPFTDIQIDFGFFYYIISVILICGIVNSVNLTDGIDGLAASTVAVVMAFFAVVGVIADNN